MADKLKDILASVKKALHNNPETPDSGEDVPEIDMEKLKGFVKGFKDQLTQASGPGIQIHAAIYIAAFILLFSFLGNI
jgi:hypothetical protein